MMRPCLLVCALVEQLTSWVIVQLAVTVSPQTRAFTPVPQFAAATGVAKETARAATAGNARRFTVAIRLGLIKASSCAVDVPPRPSGHARGPDPTSPRWCARDRDVVKGGERRGHLGYHGGPWLRGSTFSTRGASMDSARRANSRPTRPEAMSRPS